MSGKRRRFMLTTFHACHRVSCQFRTSPATRTSPLPNSRSISARVDGEVEPGGGKVGTESGKVVAIKR